MAKKKVTGLIKLQIEAGMANPAPPVGPALGPLKEFEEVFDVTAAAPVAVAAAPGAAGGDAPAEEEKDEFDVVLEAAGDKKIGVIKAVRELVPGLGLKDAKEMVEGAPKAKAVRELVPGLGLKDAKEMVEGAPKAILEGANKDDAEAAKAKLEEAGATVTLK